MNEAFQECLDDKKLVSFPGAKELVDKELGIARSDLIVAKNSYDEKGYKWSTIQSYYAIFHAARALVYSRGYREKNHHCLGVALKALFVDEGKMKPETWRSFRDGKMIRESADYDEVFSETDAKTINERAATFITEATSILNQPNQ